MSLALALDIWQFSSGLWQAGREATHAVLEFSAVQRSGANRHPKHTCGRSRQPRPTESRTMPTHRYRVFRRHVPTTQSLPPHLERKTVIQMLVERLDKDVPPQAILATYTANVPLDLAFFERCREPCRVRAARRAGARTISCRAARGSAVRDRERAGDRNRCVLPFQPPILPT